MKLRQVPLLTAYDGQEVRTGATFFRGELALLDAGSIEVIEWVIHEIPKVFRTRDDDISLKLSEAASPFDADVARFFERKMTESFSRSTHEIVPLGSHSIPVLVEEHLGSPTDGILDTSTALARHLVSVQSGSMSAGLLVVASGIAGSVPVVAVLKLEKEEGARAATTKVKGKSTYSVEYMRDLFLTGRTRVFKVAVFHMLDGGLTGWVSDPQSRGNNIADFFVEDFLGCALAVDPRTATRLFHEEAEKYINESISDPERRARYETALVAELNRNAPELNVNEFARQHLELNDRDQFAAAMKNAGLSKSFVKDVDLIKSRLRRLQYEFEGGVKVSKPVDAPEDMVRIESAAAGRLRITVEDELKRLHSRN